MASLLVAGVVGVPAAHAQDSAPPAAGSEATAPADPNAPPPAAPAYTPTVQQPGAPAPYKPVLLMPFIGVNSVQNSNSGTGVGFRIGGMGGARINEMVSANFELLFDDINISNVPSGIDAGEYFIQAAVAPLVHVPVTPAAELVVGPKAGGFYSHASLSYLTVSETTSIEGWLVGANLGAFFRVSDALSVGGLFNFDYLRAESCSASMGMCTTTGDGLKMISFTGAVQF
ncbi:MAG TPA: hypothetical protein VKZ18_18895 [Polyangia bacterium]|nr:hypothetical protein [Polyangia bacterium]